MTQKRIEWIDFEEFKKLYAAEKKKEMKLAMLLGFGSGLRISEIVGYKRSTGSSIPPLTKDKIDLPKHQIRIDSAKGGKWRTTVTPINLSENMLKLLPIKMARRTIQDRFSKLTQRVLGKHMSFHILRHGFANYQINVLKVPLPIVQQMLGHSRLDTTGIYTKANPEFAIGEAWKAMGGG